MSVNDMKNVKGFTLTELLFAIFIGVLLLGAVYVCMISGQKSSVALEGKVVAHQDARAVLEVMAMEIGMASYNPNVVGSIWRNPGDCVNASATQTYKGIQVATANSITVEMDISESGAVADNPNVVEVIAYVYDAANNRVTRATNCGTAMSFLGDIAGNPRSVRVINNTLPTPIPMFRYFDGLGNEILAANLPASIPNIRRIEITLAVETEDVAADTMQRRRMIYSTSVVPRNHAISQ
jgi:prepilin-type N-terminal cleavage/methylation domain-containing protein